MSAKKVEGQPLLEALLKLLSRAKGNLKKWSEEDLRAAFVRLDIPAILAYGEEDVRFEKVATGRKKRTDLECFDDYRATRLVIEFKKPSDSKPLGSYETKLKNDYAIPLKSRYAVLFNGIELYLYERIGSNLNLKLHKSVEDLTTSDAQDMTNLLRKPIYRFDNLNEVATYIQSHSNKTERRDLQTEEGRGLFLEDFALREGSRFALLVEKTLLLFEELRESDPFVSSAYGFWQRSYPRKPDKVPSNWRMILKELNLSSKGDDLEKFMFCLETAYALLTRLIVAKAAEDYDFPGVSLYGFLQSDMRTREYRGNITAVGWGISLVGLMDKLRYDIVESIFEEDIFYWWTGPFQNMRGDKEEFLKLQYEPFLINFSLAIRDALLTLQLYDFSRFADDPLGDLYQSYFDKETRKALGEFYTPPAVVRFILDQSGYKGRIVTEKRLLDPATGSGTFIVEALRRYLSASEEEARQKGWVYVIRRLMNDFRIVAFDIHPFATIMAQIQFVLGLLPRYKDAIDEASANNEHFNIKRLPIFRTDSLVDESKRKSTDLTVFEKGKDDIILKVRLPIRQVDDPEKFVEETVRMPRTKEVRKNTDLRQTSEYFNALQAIFDTVKHHAKHGTYETNLELLRENLMFYLEDKNFDRLTTFFAPYSDGLLSTINKLTYRFGDGRLVKSLEDVMLAGLLKNYVDYDFVVGNPPYIRIQNIPAFQKNEWADYKAATGNYDIYVLFIERGLDWLCDGGKLGYITSNRFAKVNYGEGIRNLISEKANLLSYIDFRDTGVFKDALNYPSIFFLHKPKERTPGVTKVCRMIEKPSKIADEALLDSVGIELNRITSLADYHETDAFDVFGIDERQLSSGSWLTMPKREDEVFQRLADGRMPLHHISASPKEESALSEGSSTGNKKVYVLRKIRELKSNILVESMQDHREYALESELLVPYVEDASKWLPISHEYLLIFPYRVKENDRVELIPEKDLSERYPLAYDYLKSFRKVLSQRKGFAKRKDWYAFSAPRSLPLCFKRKLMVQGFSRRSSVSMDMDGGLAFGPDVYAMAVTDLPKEGWLIVLGILNSHLADFYIWEAGVIHGSGYYKFEDRFLKSFPLPSMRDIDTKIEGELVNTVESLIEATKVKRKLMGFPDSYLVDYEDVEFKTLTIAVKPKELKRIAIDRSLDGLFSLKIPGTEQDFIFETPEETEYLVGALEAAVRRGEKELRILMPRDPSVARKVLENHSRNEEILTKMNVDSQLQDLNELVYELYDLGKKDISVIRKFLSRFSGSS